MRADAVKPLAACNPQLPLFFLPGSLVVNMQNLMDGGDDIAYLLRTEGDRVIHIVGQENEYSKLPPGERAAAAMDALGFPSWCPPD